MLDETTLEQRLAKLEQAVSELQNKVDSKPSANNWVDNLIGSISDEEAFLEALEYGRNFRKTGKFEIEEDNSVSEQNTPGDILD
ncbi:transferase hexapeptide repeat containing protein [Baaleninema sp.]|uniref:transferase hexapeptide repeat containing protein n=1 Tax=Baaleninema sp. TaxID=3101197 RepID=UPI003D080C56